MSDIRKATRRLLESLELVLAVGEGVKATPTLVAAASASLRPMMSEVSAALDKQPTVKDSLTVSDTLPSLDRADWLADKLHNGGDYGKEAAALLMKQAREIERLTAALAAAVAEPVAFRCWHPIARRAFYLSTEPPAPTRYDTGEADEYFGGKVEPLYAAPPQREPLTDEQIASACSGLYLTDLAGPRAYDIAVARAIERAHGISASASAPKERA